MWVTVRAASHPPVWIHRKCELRSLKKTLNGLCWDDDYTIAQWLEHRWLQARVPGSSPGGDSQFFLQTFPVCLFPSNQLIIIILEVIIIIIIIPGWLTSGATTLLPKTSPPSAMPKDYRPITCLPIQYKLFTAAISKIMWQHINQHEILAAEQRGCAAAGLGCKEHLMVDKMILEDAHTKGRNLVMAYLDFKKAFDSVSHEWVLHALAMSRFHASLVTTIARSMRN